jgi:hypothetical protein
MSDKQPSGHEQTASADDPASAETSAGTPPPAKSGTLARGATLGRYMILERLGGGGMGVVYTAYDPELDRKVAVKLLKPGTAGEGRVRLQREAQAMARLTHPNVIAVFDVGTLDGGEQVFVAMEFVDGQTLTAWQRAQPRAVSDVLAMYEQAGRGLHAAHVAGLIHRDFKPDNTLVGKDGRVRVLDFGLARALGAADEKPIDLAQAMTSPPAAGGALSTPLTRTGAFMGTPAYMAPEQMLAQPTDARTDQFAFCVALYEAVCGRRPFSADTLAGLLSEVSKGRVPPIPDERKVPRHVERAIARGLSVDPAARFPSMEALLDELGNDPGVSRRRRIGIAASLVLLVVAAVGAVKLRSREEQVCRGAERKLAGLWDDARRGEIRAAFDKTGQPFAAGAFDTTARALDAYAKAWTTMYTDACEATRVRGEQSAELLDARMLCLSGRLDELKATTELLARADAKLVTQAPEMALSLDPIDACTKAAAQHVAFAPPADPQTRAKVASLRQRLAAARVLNDGSRFKDALVASKPLLDEARATGYRPVEAEALRMVGFAQLQMGDYAAARATLIDGLAVAQAGRNDELAANLAIDLTHLWRYLDRVDDAFDAAKLAEGWVERLGDDPRLRVKLELALVRLENQRDRGDLAAAHGERSTRSRAC